MNKKDMIDNFGFDRKTLNNWENGAKPQRSFLYKVLEALPMEFLEIIRKREALKDESEKLLKDLVMVEEATKGLSLGDPRDMLEFLDRVQKFNDKSSKDE